MTPRALAALHAACFRTPPPWRAADFEALLADRFTRLHMAPMGTGFLLGRVIGPEAEILTLAVAPEARRQGLARGLVADFAAAHEAARILLEVAADNTPARALYAACGFHPVGRRPGYYRTPAGNRCDAVLLAREATRAPPAGGESC